MLQLRYAVLKVAEFEPFASLPGNLFAQVKIRRHVRSYCHTVHRCCDILAAALADRELKHLLRKRQLQHTSTERCAFYFRPRLIARLCATKMDLIYSMSRSTQLTCISVWFASHRKTPILVRRNLSRLSLSPDHRITGNQAPLGHSGVPTGPVRQIPWARHRSLPV